MGIRLAMWSSYLEPLQFGFRNGVGLCDDWDNIDFGIELLHTHQIQRFEPVASWADEVQANVYAAIVACGQWSFDFQLLLQISLELGINVIDDCFEWIVFVYLIAVADRIANCQLQTNAALLQFVRVWLQFHIWQSVRTWHRLEARIEQCVHQCRFAQTRFTCMDRDTLISLITVHIFLAWIHLKW